MYILHMSNKCIICLDCQFNSHSITLSLKQEDSKRPYFNRASGSWWKRTHEGDYLPIFTVDHAPLVEYLRKIGTIGTMDIPATNQPLQHGLDMIRGWINFAAPEVLLWGLFVTACLITWTKRGVKPSMSYRSSKHVGGRL